MVEHTPPPGYRDVSVPLEEIATKGLLLSLALLAVPVVIFWALHGLDTFWAGMFSSVPFLLFIVWMIAAIIAHEVVHAVGWKVAGGLRWRDLRFGIDRKTLSPYCHAKVPMTAQAYRIGALLPGIVTGLLPTLVGLLWADATWTLFGAILISAAVGDLIVLWVLRSVPGGALVLDHPANAGGYVMDRDQG